MTPAMTGMKAALHDAVERLRRMDARLLATACRRGLGPFDFVQMLGMRPGALDWFRFRAALLTRNLKRFRQAVHAGAGPGMIFGTDTHPASLASFVGHSQADWAECSDFASPLVSHVPAFVVGTLVEWSSVAGKFYTVERSSDLTTGFTVVAADLSATPPLNTILDPTATGPGPWFYRIRTD